MEVRALLKEKLPGSGDIYVVTSILICAQNFHFCSIDPLIAIYISSMNGIVPLGCKYIMEYERHQDEGARSKSLL